MPSKVHKTYLQKELFYAVKKGNKTSEAILRKGNIGSINIGDNIIFYNDEGDEIHCNVTDVRYHNSLKEMLDNNLSKVLPHINNVEQGLDTYKDIYSEDDEKRYKVAVFDFNPYESVFNSK